MRVLRTLERVCLIHIHCFDTLFINRHNFLVDMLVDLLDDALSVVVVGASGRGLRRGGGCLLGSVRCHRSLSAELEYSQC